MPAVDPGVRGGIIRGWGIGVPDKVVTNHDLAAVLDTTDEWIVERTGINERRVGGTTAGLAVDAGRAAIEVAGVDPATIDLLILATTTPDRHVPASASRVQDQLGLRCGAFDLNAACSGFVYGLAVAHGMIGAGAQRVLLIGAVDGPGQLLAWDVDSEGSAEPLLYAEVGGFMQMNGKEVFRRAVRIMVDSAEKAFAAAGVKA